MVNGSNALVDGSNAMVNGTNAIIIGYYQWNKLKYLVSSPYFLTNIMDYLSKNIIDSLNYHLIIYP